MKLGMIWAQARNGVIGNKGGLPWHLPEDLAHFKAITVGCPVIMGRKTWDSLPARFKPLPGRLNIVVTRDVAGLAPGLDAVGARVAGSLGGAFEIASGLVPKPDMAWVIGGAQMYALAEPLADVVEVTELDLVVEGDAVAPVLGGGWVLEQREMGVSGTGMGFGFLRYLRARQRAIQS